MLPTLTLAESPFPHPQTRGPVMTHVATPTQPVITFFFALLIAVALTIAGCSANTISGPDLMPSEKLMVQKRASTPGPNGAHNEGIASGNDKNNDNLRDKNTRNHNGNSSGNGSGNGSGDGNGNGNGGNNQGGGHTRGSGGRHN